MQIPILAGSPPYDRHLVSVGFSRWFRPNFYKERDADARRQFYGAIQE